MTSRLRLLMLLILVFGSLRSPATDQAEMRQRRKEAAAALRDGILLVHSRSELDWTADGFRQDPVFYYLTGLENTAGAWLAIDGLSGENWLFLATDQPLSKFSPQEVTATPGAAGELRMEKVVDWSELETFLTQRARKPGKLYYVGSRFGVKEFPPNLSGSNLSAPLWATTIAQRWPSLRLEDAGDRVWRLMDIESAGEITQSRAAAKATVAAVMAGMRAIRPGVSQRAVEAAVENACWQQGAHGSSFWPWAMAGENGVFPRPFTSSARYDHLQANMRAGDLVRLDVGCEWQHYQGDLGRTVPVSGHYSDDQRETWNIFVAAYRAGVKTLRPGSTPQNVFAAWSAELLHRSSSVKSMLAMQAVNSWSRRENVPYWQLHTINLDARLVDGPLQPGMVIAFEPIASVGGQGYYLEDMYLITRNGAERLTPGVPYTAEEVESAMSDGK